MPTRILSAILFSPRGGSAHAARALATGLRAHGLTVTLVAGSRQDLGDDGDARPFYGEVEPVAFDAALAADDPLLDPGAPGSAPMHPSFEDRAGAPDQVFAALDDTQFEAQVVAWGRELTRAGIGEADLVHVHHLTPINEAVARVAPELPVIGQLHGTELLMLEQILSGMPPVWAHGPRWAARMRAWAERCARLVVAPGGVERAAGLLGVPVSRFVTLPGGVDPAAFAPRRLDRAAFWRRALSEEPRGWRPGEPPGSVRYAAEETAALAHAIVLLYVGRFTAVKRLDRMIDAFATARREADRRTALVLLGGHPGEWEGEHPLERIERLGIEDVYLAGWHSHARLADYFAASDAVVTASEREQFGQTLVEGMACGLPAVAVRSFGPELIIDDGETGWLVDDEAGLARALVEVVDNGAERARRGAQARDAVCERFTWSSVAGQLAEVIEDVLDGAQPAAARLGR